MTPVYKIENFKFRYPHSNMAISIAGTLHINYGDIVLLQGDSGSGKSSLLLALKGIIPNLINGSLSGTILFHKQNLFELEDTSCIGYLGQNPHNQLICDTVYQELAFGLENQGIPSLIIQQKIEEYSARFKITHFLQREVRNLSGGEKQKINLLAILIMEPEVLLLDEPTAFLDPESATEIISIIHGHTQQKTVIIIEHNIHYLKNFVNRVIIIDKHGQTNEYNPASIDFSPISDTQPCKSIINAYSTPVLSINNMSFTYKGMNSQTPLLNNINLDVYHRQIVGIIGKNGSGKSSLLKLISKIIPCKSCIYYKQQDIHDIKAGSYWREISLLWQNPENHFLYHNVGHELNNDVALMQQFALEESATQNPYCLSEGQKRRLSLAISIKPDIA
ncbi:MAG: hypothetical protein K0R49_1691, partial [Burkholderiales bacterium]|nr:hypothetical protein [Burkholderiales bacterium]